jgi:hypoxanthine phosphoribosyltransferase
MNQEKIPILITSENIQRRVKELGSQITTDYASSGRVDIVSIMNGAAVFTADLARSIQIPCHIEYIRASSYGNGRHSSGQVTLNSQPGIEGRSILLVEDIIDTGLTVNSIVAEFLKYNPVSLKICTLIDKPSKRQFPVIIDYFGFRVPDRFLVGYGMDYAEEYRDLPFIGMLQP